MAINLSLALILLGTWLNASETFILSYRAQIKNAVVISESFHITPTMKSIHAIPGESLNISTDKEEEVQKILLNNKDTIIDFMMKHGLHTRSHEKVQNKQSSSLISITIPPSYITVDFKNDYAIITRLIQQ